MKDIHYFLQRKTNPSKGEVFTPESLVQEMLDKIPVEVWENPNSLFLDPCMGRGIFLIEIVNKLVYIYGYTEQDAQSRVYGYDTNIKYVGPLRRRGFANVQNKDFLNEEFNMKFDVIIGNPPYQEKVGNKKTEPLWNKFVKKSFQVCKENGYVSLIHPSGWRSVDGKFKDVQQLIKSKNVTYLSINDEKKGIEVFGATTSFDWYVVKNEENNSEITKVETSNGEIIDYNINNLDFIPGGNFELFQNLVASDNEEKVNVIHSYSAYETRKDYISKERIDDFIYPCVYTIIKNGDINFYWSNTNENGFFGVPKIIWTNGMASQPTLDLNGEYGLTQFAYAIVDTLENLIKIKQAMDSPKFLNTMKFCYMSSGNRFDKKILSTFKKDFWREFIDE
jgi:16S rRNA G966 N2-methylase RsmD